MATSVISETRHFYYCGACHKASAESYGTYAEARDAGAEHDHQLHMVEAVDEHHDEVPC